jgi:hypothetical protein
MTGIMPREYLHNHPQFADLIRIVAEEKGIDPALVEKDYWIMHYAGACHRPRLARTRWDKPRPTDGVICWNGSVC